MARLVYSPCYVIDVDWQLLQSHSFSEEKVPTYLLLTFILVVNLPQQDIKRSDALRG